MKMGAGIGAINHQFKRAQAPLGDAQGNITQQLKKIICYFLPPWLDNSIPTLGVELHIIPIVELSAGYMALQNKWAQMESFFM